MKRPSLVTKKMLTKKKKFVGWATGWIQFHQHFKAVYHSFFSPKNRTQTVSTEKLYTALLYEKIAI